MIPLDDIRSCYAPLGEPVRFAPGSQYRHCLHWRNGTMSPLFLTRRTALDARLRGIERHFSSRPARHPYDQACYAVWLGMKRKEAVRRLPAGAAARGWTVHEKPGSLELWREVGPAVLPRGFHFASGRYFDRRLHRDFRRMMAENFGAAPAFMRELDAMHRGIERRLRTVVIYHESGAAAGAGLVAAGAPGAFLYCGSIAARHRRKGLWRALVGLRQLVSLPLGARLWATSTRVPSLMGKGQASFPFSNLVKNSL